MSIEEKRREGMKRDINKLVEAGKSALRRNQNSRFVIFSGEMEALHSKRKGDVFGVMYDSFCFGVAQGIKIAEKEAAGK